MHLIIKKDIVNINIMKTKTNKIMLALFFIYITNHQDTKKKKLDLSKTEMSSIETIDLIKNLDYQLDDIVINLDQFTEIYNKNRITDFNNKVKRLNIKNQEFNEYSKVTIDKNKSGGIIGKKTGSLSIKRLKFAMILNKIKKQKLLPSVEIITEISDKFKF